MRLLPGKSQNLNGSVGVSRKFKLPTRACEDYNIGAITGISDPAGDYRGPVKNGPPNPGNYWWGSVLRRNIGWVQVQEIGRSKTEAAMLALGADPTTVPIPRQKGG